MTMSTARTTKIIAIVAGAAFLGFGLWAFLDPESFFEELANFPPYNEHFIHDIGAFQIGIGAMLLLCALWADGITSSLAGAGIGSAVHTIAHIVDRDLGGKDSDPWLFGAITVVLLGAAVVRRRPPRGRRSPGIRRRR